MPPWRNRRRPPTRSSRRDPENSPVRTDQPSCHDAGMTIVLPDGLDEQRELGPDWGVWLGRLPRLFADVLDDWELARDGDQLWHGFCSLVAPVLTNDGQRAVLKVSFDGDEESRDEALV